MDAIETVSEFAAARGLAFEDGDAALFLQARRLVADPETNEHTKESAKAVLATFSEWFAKGGQRRFTFAEFALPFEADND